MEKNDQQLLAEFLNGHDRAFTALVHRHIDLIYSAALRQTNPTLADDITQAVFILLARKARSLRRHTNLAGWLFKTTHYIASKSLRAELRRRRREQQALAMQQLHTDDHAWEQIKPQLDAAVATLREPDRSVLLHRYFNNQTVAQTSHALNLTEDITKKSSSRALEKLRHHFAKHGFTITAAALITALQTRAITAAPQATIAKASAAATTINTTLVTATLAAWRLAFLRNLALITIPIVFVSALVATQLNNPALKPNSSAIATSRASLASQQEPLTEINSTLPLPTTSRALLFRVLDATTDRPITNALIPVCRVGDEWLYSYDTFTDSSGVARIHYPENIGRLDIGFVKAGWEAKFATWRTDLDGAIPAEYTMRATAIPSTLGGIIFNESGQPIAGAEVAVSIVGSGDYAGKEPPRERPGFVSEIPLGQTDSQGRWTCALLADSNKGFSISATHRDYVTADVCTIRSTEPMLASSNQEVQKLLAKSHTTVMKRGLILAGLVENQAGDPIAGAKIRHGADFKKNEFTDETGKFQIRSQNRGAVTLIAQADAYSPKKVSLQLLPDSEPFRIRLDPAGMLLLKIVDENGEPVPDAIARAVEPLYSFTGSSFDWFARSDAAGQIQWNSAPQNTAFEIMVHKSGYIYATTSVTAKSEVHTVTLRPALTADGTVVDAQTQAPIAEFKVIPRTNPRYGRGLARENTRRGSNGKFHFEFSEPGNPRLHIEADGYESADSDVITNSTTLHFALKPGISKPEPEPNLEPKPEPTPQAILTGIVLDPEGNPAPNANVALLRFFGGGVSIGKAQFVDHGRGGIFYADDSGAFSIPFYTNAHSVAAIHQSGFSRLRIPSPGSPITIRLQPFAALQGRINPNIKQPYNFVALSAPLFAPFGIWIDQSLTKIEPDANGHFAASHLPPGLYLAHLGIQQAGIPFHHRRALRLEPGGSVQFDFKEDGPFVKGKITSHDLSSLTHLSLSLNRAGPNSPMIPEQARNVAQLDYWSTEDAATEFSKRFSYLLEGQPDGSFKSNEGIQPGEYEIVTRLDRTRMKATITVPTSAASKPELDLGDIRLEPVPD